MVHMAAVAEEEEERSQVVPAEVRPFVTLKIKLLS